MKVAITGVAGAGKSTLCQLIAKHTDLVLMPDFMDTYLWENGYTGGKELAEKTGEPGVIQWYIRALQRKVEEDEKGTHFIADKSILDHGARWFARKFPLATPEQYGEVECLLERGKCNYNKLIFLPINPLNSKAVDNAMRDVDFKHRYLIELILYGLAHKYQIPLNPYEFRFTDNPKKVIADLGLEQFLK